MAYRLLQALPAQYEDVNGSPLVGGSIEAFVWNTTTSTPLYSDASGTSLGVSVSLNSRGEPQSSGGTAVQLFGSTDVTSGYKIVRKDADGSVIPPTLGPIFLAATSNELTSASQTHTPDGGSSVSLATYLNRTNYKTLYDFGGVSDGVTNNDTAIAAAWTYFSTTGGALFIPRGVWKFNSDIAVPSNMEVFGEGYASVIDCNGQFGTVGASHVDIHHLRVEPTAGTGLIIEIRGNGTDVKFHHNHVINNDIDDRPLGMINPLGTTDATTAVQITNNYCYRLNTVNDMAEKGWRSRGGLGTNFETTYQIIFHDNIIIIEVTDPTGNADVGYECWTTGSSICGNIIIAPEVNGNFSGISLGGALNSVCNNNLIFGYAAGIELGNNDAGNITCTGNTIVACQYGITVSSSGEEELLTFSGNHVVFDDKYRTDYLYAFYLKCKNATITGNSAVHVDSSSPPSFTDFTDTDSRKYIAFYGDTNNDTCTFTGNTIKGFTTGFRFAATYPYNTISGNTFENVSYPVYDLGSAPYNMFVGNTVHNFYQLVNNGQMHCTGNTFSRDATFVLPSGVALSTAPFCASIDSLETVVTNIGNAFENCADTAFAGTGQTAYAVSNIAYSWPTIEKTEHWWKIGNVNTWANAKTQILLAAPAVPFDVPIKTHLTNYLFIKRQSAKNADVVDGSDVIENCGP